MSPSDPYILKSDLLSLFTTLEYARLATPVSNPAQASEVVFKRFGISQVGEAFNKGWHIAIQEASEAKYLQAFCTGSLFFEKGAGPNKLILYNGDALASIFWKNDVPDWFPAPNVIVYANIDETLSRTLLKDYLDRNPNVFKSITKDLTGVDSTDTFLDKYFAMEIHVAIPVQAGLRIGAAGIGTGSDREVDFYIQIASTDSFFVDPAIYIVHWEDSFMDLSGHHLYASFRDMFGPLVANGTIRYVGSGGAHTGDFLDPISPAIDVASAVAVANDYDTILILDKGDVNLGEKYIENLKIIKPLSITYLNPGHIDVTTLTSLETFDWPDLPILQGGTNGSVIEVFQVDGYVSISNIIITGGSFSSTGSYDVTGGGGVLVYYSDRTHIYNCLLISNKVPLGSELNGHGGGIYFYQSSSYIFRCNVSENESSERGAGIFVGPYSWPVIRQNLISFNKATGVRADGGGIGATVAHPRSYDLGFDSTSLEKARNRRIRIIENRILNNTAIDDGGGVYLSVMARASFKRNEIASNIAHKAGGGIRASLGSDIQMEGDTVYENQCNFLYTTQDNFKNGGGGLATRNADLILHNVTILDNINHAFSGGGIYLSSSSEGEIGGLEELPEAWDAILIFGVVNYDDILRDYYLKTEVRLQVTGNARIAENIVSRFEDQTEDSRKGGGIYILRFRSDNFTALPLKVLIEDFSCLTGNRNDQVTHPGSDNTALSVAVDSAGTAEPTADQFYLYDMVGDYFPPEQHEPDIWILDTLTATGFLDDQNTLVWPPAGAL